MIKVYKLNDYEWYAGESMQECIDWVVKNFGDEDNKEDIISEDAHEVLEAQMNTLIFVDDDGNKMTFKQQLDKMIESGEKFPCPFAFMDW